MSKESLELLEPCAELEAEFSAYCGEFAPEGHIPGNNCMAAAGSFMAGVRNCRDYARGVNLPEGWVPAHSFWLVRDRRTIIGTIDLRHSLTPYLEAQGGHVGYSVRPGERGNGYATRMLEGVLKKAGELGLRRVLITCDKDNIASARVIQKCGGVLQDEVPSAQRGRQLTQRYWIAI